MNVNVRRLEQRFDLEGYIAGYDPKDVGANWAITCPNCEKQEKLYVLKQDKKDRNGELVPRGTYLCYRCSDEEGTMTGRGILSLIEELEDVSFYEACKRLADGGTQADVNFSDAVGELLEKLDNVDDDADDAKPLDIPEIELPVGFRPINERNAPAYLVERGISVERARRYRLGFCMTGYYRKRLIVPSYLEGRLVSFQARYMRKVPPKGIKKTVFPKGAKQGQVLFNYDVARYCRRVVVCEDPFSAMRVGKTGTSTFGTHLSRGQFELLLNSAAREVVMLWDNDAIDKAIALAEQLAQFWRIRVVRLPDERDADEYSVKSLVRMIERAAVLDATSAFAENVRTKLASL